MNSTDQKTYKKNPTRFSEGVLRALGMTDLNPISKTAGCSDRNYWHYQDGKGFPVGSFQSAQLAFYAASLNVQESKETWENAADLSMRWWATRILKKGALEEYFADQESFCATAHTTCATALVLAGSYRSKKEVPSSVKEALFKSLLWLKKQKSRPDSANQTMAARIAWDLAETFQGFEVDGPNPFQPSRSNTEGWFLEYGGFDVGYHLMCLDLCAMALGSIKEESKRTHYQEWAEVILQILHRVLVQYTFHPALGSRGNPHRLTGGLEVFSRTGNNIACELLSVLENPSSHWVDASQSDDKYFVFFHLPSLLLSEHMNKPMKELLPFPIKVKSMPSEIVPSKWFLKEAGLYFFKAGTERAAISMKQGGAICLENEIDQLVDCGYAFREEEKLYATLPAEVSPKMTEEGLEVFLKSVVIPERMAQVQSLKFQIALRSLLSISFLRSFLNQWILNAVGKKKASSKVFARRIVKISSGRLEIIDEFLSDHENVFKVHNWSFTDGHSTRFHSKPNLSFTRINGTHQGSFRKVLVLDTIKNSIGS